MIQADPALWIQPSSDIEDNPLARLDAPVYAYRDASGELGLSCEGRLSTEAEAGAFPVVASVPALPPEQLGDAHFRQAHGVRYAYIAGAMAGGIGSAEIVIAMARAGMLGFFGAGGVALPRIEEAILKVQRALDAGQSYGFNLLHSPFDPAAETNTAELYLKHQVRRVSASAYIDLTPPLVHYRCQGLHRAADGSVEPQNHVFAKLSRPEVALRFMLPPPEDIVRQLVKQGKLSETEAQLAREIPMAEEITAEADSGGHTDNQPAIALWSTIRDLRDKIMAEQGYRRPIRFGAAGGVGTPTAAMAAFSCGAAYLLTGSINQACREAATSDLAKQMLCEVELGSTVMAPAADMFEMGVQVQVSKHRTLFALRARKLYELYRRHASLDELPAADREQLETKIFRLSIDEIWRSCEEFFSARDPRQLERAQREPKHKMALVFRWYLGMGSRWAIQGEPSRTVDYQMWCGPAMAAFNQWVKGSFLEAASERGVVIVGQNLMHGAAYLARCWMLSTQGIAVPPEWQQFRPLRLESEMASVA